MKSARIMMVYAAFMVVCGLVAFFRAPPGSNAATALVVPSIAAFLMVVCGVMAASFHRSRTVGMIGIHAGLVLPILFAIAFGMRAWKTFDTGGMDKRYLAYTLAALTLGSVVAFLLILKTRPSKQMRQ